jgi:hypothetical protein
MNESTLSQLKILVERTVRPVRASTSHKQKMREELLAHVTSVFEEEVARLANEQAALERTAQRFGNPAELTGQLQESVPTLDSIERFADWAAFRPCESTLRRAVRYMLIFEVAALLLLSYAAVLLLLGGVVSEWPTDALWHTCLVLLLSGYLGFTLCIFESSMRRSLGEQLGEQKRSSWLQFALVVVGSTIVSMTLGLLAYGVSPKNAIWIPFFTVGAPVWLAWGLANAFAARNRCHEDWASLPIE